MYNRKRGFYPSRSFSLLLLFLFHLCLMRKKNGAKENSICSTMLNQKRICFDGKKKRKEYRSKTFDVLTNETPLLFLRFPGLFNQNSMQVSSSWHIHLRDFAHIPASTSMSIGQQRPVERTLSLNLLQFLSILSRKKNNKA